MLRYWTTVVNNGKGASKPSLGLSANIDSRRWLWLIAIRAAKSYLTLPAHHNHLWRDSCVTIQK